MIGEVNRQNATLALVAAKLLKPDMSEKELIAKLNQFPSSWRRFEKIADNLYTDYAHNPVKIAGCLQIAKELDKPIVVVYEPIRTSVNTWSKTNTKICSRTLKKFIGYRVS